MIILGKSIACHVCETSIYLRKAPEILKGSLYDFIFIPYILADTCKLPFSLP